MRAGKHRFKPLKGREHVPQLAVDDVVVTAGEIPNYCDDTFFSAMECWQLTKMWGLAHGGGWADEPREYIEAISILESESNAIQQEEMEKMKDKSSAGSSTEARPRG